MADLYVGTDTASALEIEAVDAVVDASQGPALIQETERLIRGGKRRIDERRQHLLPCLHALQRAAGWISPGGLNYVSTQLQVPPAEAYGVATFYDLLRTDEPETDGDITHVCVDVACHIAGGPDLLAQLKNDGVAAHSSPCLGQCERAPALYVQGRNQADSVAADSDPVVVPQLGDPTLKLLGRVGRVDPASVESYIAFGGYKALAKAFTLGAPAIVEEVAASGLMGRGGAAFPTGVKWRAVAAESGQKHVVVNADESEPGTFKDRYVMENDPFAVIEAATIAAFATGASKGWIYIRGEYPLATQRLENALAQARDIGFLGDNIARSSFSFDIELRRGAGAYICGEETALFASIEGYRGEPRQKPPFPVTHGLFGEPTAINNPETLLNVLDIVLDGGAEFAKIGTAGSTGPKLFCLSGHVAKPGVYEAPFGTTMREVIDLAGGVTGTLRSVLVGGAAGTFVGPELLDMPLTLEDARANGVSLGSGVVMVFNDETDFFPVVERVAKFFRDESCGQCVPCRVGTVRQHELVIRSKGTFSQADLTLLDDMDQVLKDASICGFGHAASIAVRSAIALGLIGTEGAGQ